MPVVSDARLWELLRAVVVNGDAAWPALAAELEPALELFARNQPIGRLRDREDTPREVMTRVLARLHAREFATIHRLCALDPAPELRAWLRVLVRRSAIDYMRESPEFERGNAIRPHKWVSLWTLSSGQVAPSMDSLEQKRTLVLDFVRDACTRGAAEFREHGEDAYTRLGIEWKIGRIHVRRLVQKGAQYLAVLDAVLAGRSYPETAERLGITRREVELTVRYIEELLAARGFAERE